MRRTHPVLQCSEDVFNREEHLRASHRKPWRDATNEERLDGENGLRCDAWRCKPCSRAFLRYTEYGGYYTEERIRERDADHIVDVALTA